MIHPASRAALALLFTCLFLFSLSPVWGQSYNYSGTWLGQNCNVTLNFSTASDHVDGTITIAGTPYNVAGSVNGSNITIGVAGDPPFTFARLIERSKEYWQNEDGSISFFRYLDGGGSLPGTAAGGSLPGTGAIPGGGMPSARPKPDPQTTNYAGFWANEPVSVTIHWDNFAGQGPVEGTIVYRGNPIAFTGDNPRRGYMELTIPGSGLYTLNKSGSGEGVEWTGRSGETVLTFGRTLGEGNSRPPGGGLPGGTTYPTPSADSGGFWIIACEAVRDQSAAQNLANTWRSRGFPDAGILHLSEYRSLGGNDQNYWVVYPVAGSKEQVQSQLSRVKRFYSGAYGVKADQNARRLTL